MLDETICERCRERGRVMGRSRQAGHNPYMGWCVVVEGWRDMRGAPPPSCPFRLEQLMAEEHDEAE